MARNLSSIHAEKAVLYCFKDVLGAALTGLKAHLETFDDERESPKVYAEKVETEQRIAAVDKTLKELHDEELERRAEHKQTNPGKHHRKGG